MNTFSTGSALQFGWETFKKRSWFLIGATLLGLVLSLLASMIKAPSGSNIVLSLVAFLAGLGCSTLVDIGIIAFVLRAHDDIADVSLKDLWHPQSFWYYLAAVVLVSVSVIAGLILLIIPGIILGLMWAFVKFLVVDRNLGPIEAMKESTHITRGHRLELLLLFLALLGLNLLGFIALGVGLLITGPISMLALAHAYRALAQEASSTSASSSIPAN